MRMQYCVNEEKRTVVATVVDCECDVIRKVRRKLNNRFGESFLFHGDKSYLPEKFVGRAKCCDEDVFDAEYGRRLAASRAMDKYLRAVNREIEAVRCELETMQEELSDLFHLDDEGYII